MLVHVLVGSVALAGRSGQVTEESAFCAENSCPANSGGSQSRALRRIRCANRNARHATH
jgi:hypothetical protein